MQSAAPPRPSKTRTIALVLLGLATVVGFLYFQTWDVRMHDAGGPGILRFEMVADRITAARIMSAWGTAGQDAAKDSLYFDFAYLLIYGAFLVLAIRTAAGAMARRGYDHLAWMGSWIWLFGVMAALFDVLEDLMLLAVLNGNTSHAVPALATYFAVMKFAFILGAGLYLIVTLIALARNRTAATAS